MNSSGASSKKGVPGPAPGFVKQAAPAGTTDSRSPFSNATQPDVT